VDWVSAVGLYAQRLHGTVGGGHHVASPLGAWLLLALASPAGGDGELADALGMEAGPASEVAAALLDRPHPLVTAAAAVWHRDGMALDGPAAWLEGLPAAVAVGPLPDRAGVDRWVRRRTLGLISSSPVEPDPAALLTLASALATRVSWKDPFEVDSAAALGEGSAWASRLTSVLRTPGQGHLSFVARSQEAGEVIVHVAEAGPTYGGDGLRVVSVAAASDVEPRRVLAAAYEIAPSVVLEDRPPSRVSLFDLPLGVSPLWTISEREMVDRRREHYTAVLPSWSATSEHDLSAPELGFAGLARALGPGPFQARQAAMARYSRYGFEAAAATITSVRSVPPRVVARLAELRFAHPYAVVAVATQPGRGASPGPWHGAPVFSAWVADPQDVSDTDDQPE